MSRQRSISRVLVVFAAMATFVGAMSAPAWAANVGTDRSRIGFEADFGSGTHIGGTPGLYRVDWDYTPVGGVVRVTARVRGTLYLDRLGSGCARLLINFQDIDADNLTSTRTTQFCGPGFDANASANKRAVDQTFASTSLRRVSLAVGSGSTLGSIELDHAAAHVAPSVNGGVRINNGTADFGGTSVLPAHFGGSPSLPAPVTLVLGSNTSVVGRVRGTLFVDSTRAGCSRVLIEFKDVNDANLATRTRDRCAPSGGDALDAANQRVIDESFTSPALFKIRVRVGRVAGGAFVGTVVSQTHGFGSALGTTQGIPPVKTVPAQRVISYGVRWTVPAPAVWRSLDLMEVRLVEDGQTALQFRWDEATDEFRQIDPEDGSESRPALPGSSTRFRGCDVALLLRRTSVVGSGPTGRSVVLDLGLVFARRAAGRTYTVEALARDDEGVVQGWDVAGQINVLPQQPK
jgi:hypothetical protein